MPAVEQAEIFRDGLLGHRYSIIEHYSAMLEMMKSAPETLTPEILALFQDAIAPQVQWLASHGIVWPKGVVNSEA